MKPARVKAAHWYHYNLLFFLEHLLGYKRFKKYLGHSQQRLFQKIDHSLGTNNTGKVLEVELVDQNLSREDFMNQCYQPGLPKLFRGAAKNWEAVKKWNLDFFESNYGNEEIIINDNVGLSDQQFETMPFKHYIQQLRSGSLKYLRFSDVVNHNESLKNDFDMTWLRRFNLPLSWGEDTKMFMGSKGTLTTLHVGFSDFLFVQVTGRKKWILYPPNNRIFLDPRTERTFHYYSKANPHKKDDPDFPLLKHAEQYEVYLEPGDILWVPSFTWHHVENLSDSIGIRCGRSSLLSAAKSSKVLMALIFMATKPNIISYAITTRTQKRSLVFAKSYKELDNSVLEKLKLRKRAAD